MWFHNFELIGSDSVWYYDANLVDNHFLKYNGSFMNDNSHFLIIFFYFKLTLVCLYILKWFKIWFLECDEKTSFLKKKTNLSDKHQNIWIHAIYYWLMYYVYIL